MPNDRMIWFDIDVFQDALDSVLDSSEKIIGKAIYSTMKRARRHAMTRLSTEIRSKWNISKKELDKRIRVKVSSRGERYESFEMIIKGASISLAHYTGTKQYAGNKVINKTVGRQNKRTSKFQGVQVELIKGRKVRLSGAFIQAASSGHMMVMRRKGKGRYPLQVKATISPASMFSESTTADRFEEGLLDFIERTFEHELNWRLQQAGLV